jgi:hypothetical protein
VSISSGKCSAPATSGRGIANFAGFGSELEGFPLGELTGGFWERRARSISGVHLLLDVVCIFWPVALIRQSDVICSNFGTVLQQQPIGHEIE